MGTFGASLVLRQTSAQTAIANQTDTAIVWNSAEYNSGPASWWSAGAPTQIVTPWAGPYLFSCQVRFNESATGRRCMHLNRTTTIAAGNFLVGGCQSFLTTEQAGSVYSFDTEVNLAAETHLVTVWHNAGAALAVEADDSLPYISYASFTYLGT